MHTQRIFRCRCGAPIGKLGEFVLQVGSNVEEFCSKEHLELACRSINREALLSEHERQTNQKCREFGMPPYYTERRDFPRSTGDP